MIGYIDQFQDLKDKIPEFITKLYHILESNEYSEYMCWNGDSEIQIKHGKKLEEKVLPLFFRHRHLSSFVRQLNMYKFNKVNKLTKQKNHMYFRNEYFKRGEIQNMIKIQRNNRNNRKKEEKQSTPDNIMSDHQHSEVSINRELQSNALGHYKQYVKNTVREIYDNIKKIELHNPEVKGELDVALNLCNDLMQGEVAVQTPNPNTNQDQNIQNKNMLSTMKLLPRLQSLIFPSQCSFYHFN